jgi:hypothetical protein
MFRFLSQASKTQLYRKFQMTAAVVTITASGNESLAFDPLNRDKKRVEKMMAKNSNVHT